MVSARAEGEVIERRRMAPELSAIHKRLDDGDVRMAGIEASVAENTALTREIRQNTAGFVAFQGDLESGARFFCRCLKGIRFVLKDVIEPYWKPALIVFVVVYWMTHDYTLPAGLADLLKRLLS